MTRKFSTTLLSHLSILLSGLLTVMSACNSGSSGAPSVIALSVIGPSSLAAGFTGQVTATATYSDSTAKDVTAAVTWSSDAPATLSVSDDYQNKGFLRAAAVGKARIRATVSGQTGEAEIEVSDAVIQAIAITPTSGSLVLGTTLQLAAAGTFSDGSSKDITSTVTWTSDDASVVQISSAAGVAGLAMSAGEGTTQLRAAVGNVTASVQVTVTPALISSLQVSASAAAINIGDTTQLSGLGTYTDATMADLTESVTWTSADEGLLTISNDAGTRGLATAVASGTVKVTATIGNVSASYDVTIN